MYWNRLLENTLSKTLTTFPVVVITGPRQSGKSTLLHHVFSRTPATFLLLDNPDFRRLLQDDPLSYLEQQQRPVILDEIQYMPELLPYIKILADQDKSPGQWIVTGSQQFSLMKHVSESLAGRAAILSLPPFQLAERKDISSLEQYLLSSSYPALAVNPEIDRDIWYSSYLQTYLERDVRAIMNIENLRDFEQFIRLLAAYTSQELTYSTFSRWLGISVPTIKRWISALEASYIIFLLPPYYQNYGKCLIKSPKIYFYDTGLVNYLIGIRDANVLMNGPLAGAIFENAMVSEMMKDKYASGVRPELYFWRSRSGMEVDIIIPNNGQQIPCEIKLSSTIKPLFYKHLQSWLELSGQPEQTGYLITNCQKDLPLPQNIRNIYWRDITQIV